MKNIHVLQTDKPSNIVIATIDGKLKLNNNTNDSVEYHGENQHIYITSDEKIKDGDWFLTDDKRVEKCAPDWRAREWHKKIILTTDQDLIEDGVQAIDDEFLNWFVKNPSCESVEVLRYPIERLYTIIPKEEPTIVRFPTYYESKQETLEEVVNNFKKTDVYINEIKQEQDKKLYSEEEVIELLNRREEYTSQAPKTDWFSINQWFEQFKNK